MKKDIEEIIEIPENVQVEIVGDLIVIKSQGKEIKKTLNFNNIEVRKDANKIKATE